MLFGLKNAPESFQKTMVSVLAKYIERFCGVYIDDVVVYTEILCVTLGAHVKTISTARVPPSEMCIREKLYIILRAYYHCRRHRGSF